MNTSRMMRALDSKLSKPKNKDYDDKYRHKSLERGLEPQLPFEFQNQFTERLEEEFAKRGWEETICRKHGTPLEIETEYNDHPGERQPYTVKTIVFCPECKKEYDS